jgi:pimeloyl-ACP methyl ester carboxylesterase
MRWHGVWRRTIGWCVRTWLADMVTLLARLRAETLHWFGTSMGGLIGMTLAGMPGASGAAPVALEGSHEAQARTPSLMPAPISRIVLNDVGPHLLPEALARIGTYVGEDIRFDTFDQAVDYTRAVSASFGPHTEQQWLDLTQHIVRPCDGGWVKHYDLGLAAPFSTMTPDMAALGEAMLWHAYAAIACPILVVRGAQSDLLSSETAQSMLAANPRASLLEVPGVGHAPTFLDDAQIDLAEAFLLA